MTETKSGGDKFSITFIIENGNLNTEFNWESDNINSLVEGFIKLIIHIRSPNTIADLEKIFKDVCKKIKRKDLYSTFRKKMQRLMTIALSGDENAVPAVGPLEVLKR